MSLNNAIKLAVEKGGYPEAHKEVCCYLMDPAFWVALGKALGLEKHQEDRHWGNPGDAVEPMWKRKWHRFVDHIAEGKSPDEFFSNLIKE